jgi:hypothetical protein
MEVLFTTVFYSWLIVAAIVLLTFMTFALADN